MPFTIVRQDITKMPVDAIVNAANTELLMGGGVCGAIFKAAGVKELQEACAKLAPIKTGDAVITPGFALPAKYVIHTAGPVYHQWEPQESARLLRSAYLNSLSLALANQCESIAFPLISSGIYGYPKKEALQVATSAIQDFLTDHDLDVYLVIFDKNSFAISEKLLGEVASYIDDHYIEEHEIPRRQLLDVERKALDPKWKTIESESIENEIDALQEDEIDTLQEAEIDTLQEAEFLRLHEPMPHIAESPIMEPTEKEATTLTPTYRLEDLISNLDEPFSTTLLRLIDAKGKTDVEVYKRANLDRKLFSKIRNNKDYRPSKRTVLALAIALELNLQETEDLLQRAGFALSHSQKFDVIIEYFIIKGKYDIFEINEVLFNYDQPLLGG